MTTLSLYIIRDKMNKKITIKDIAEIAGVSFKTVSRVINNESGVKEETRNKVRKALQQCNYSTNYFAKNLRKKSNNTIIISAKKEEGLFLNQWSGVVLKNIINEAKSFNYEVLIDYFEGDKVNKNILESGYIDGAVVFDAFEDDARIKELNRLNIPFVIVGKHSSETYVTCMNYDGGYIAADYLFSRGLSNIFFILGPIYATANLERLNGFKQAHKDNAVDYKEKRIFSGISGYDNIYKVVKDIIERGERPDAFFISGDERALGCIKAINEADLIIPDDISVFGFDDIPLAEYIQPSLTTIRQDLTGIGKNVFIKLLDKIEGREVESLEIPVKLIIRESVK
jgi:DNA-binding LacI/PurR family transcriptional regulator